MELSVRELKVRAASPATWNRARALECAGTMFNRAAWRLGKTTAVGTAARAMATVMLPPTKKTTLAAAASNKAGATRVSGPMPSATRATTSGSRKPTMAFASYKRPVAALPFDLSATQHLVRQLGSRYRACLKTGRFVKMFVFD